MSSPAKTSYAKSGEVYVAYQVTGKGPVDLLLAPGFISHLEHSWEEPQLARWQLAMSQFARFIRFDKRGTGLSDRSVGIPHLDERMDDIRAVLDAVGSSKAALMGVSEGGPMSILFAATYPERVSALILCGTYATICRPDQPWARTAIANITGWWTSTGAPARASPGSDPDRLRTRSFAIGGRGWNGCRPAPRLC
jgi:pimeloyl-ACP methyl ester carboxylesterase